jgi:hypothetical protein
VAGISTQHQPVFPLQAKPSCGMAVKIVRDPKSGKFLSFHPSNNKFFTLMMQKYLVSRIKGLTK